MKLYSVYDKKSMVYGQVMTCQDEIQAKRLFERAVQDEDTMLFHYPEDFVLTLVAEMDDKTGLVEGLSMPRQVLEANSCFSAVKE